MGTSASSMGPGAGVSLDPEWLDDIELPNQDNDQPDCQNDDDSENDNQSDEKEPDYNEKLVIAPKFRFASARRGMGEYVRSGSKDSLRKSLGHYSKTGMGGSKNLSKRMRTSTKAAANFFAAAFQPIFSSFASATRQTAPVSAPARSSGSVQVTSV